MPVLGAAILGALIVLAAFGVGVWVGRRSASREIVRLPTAPIELVDAAIKTATVAALHGKLTSTSSREPN